MVSLTDHSSTLFDAEPGAKIGGFTDAAIDTIHVDMLDFSGTEMQVECVQSISGLEVLAEDWNELYQASNEPFLYFQSFDWCLAWAREFLASSEFELKIYTARKGSDLIAIWPMATVVSKSRAKVLITLTEPLGQYSGILCHPDYVDPAFGKQMLKLIKEDCCCDSIAITNCPIDSVLGSIVCDDGFEEETRPVSAILDLEQIPDWEEYHASLPKNQRRQRNKRRNKLNALGEVQYDVFPGGSSEYRDLIEKCLEFKQIWLKETGRREGILAEERTQRFLSSLSSKIESGKQTFGAVAHCMSVDGKPVGIELGMIAEGDYYSYLGAIDWDLKDYSPGKIQMEMTQRWAKDFGIRRFDFLSDPSDYKAYWTNTTHELFSRNIPITWKGYVYAWVWKTNLKPRLKRFYHKTGAANRELFNKVFNMIGKSK